MSTWSIKYRDPDGVAFAHVAAATKEQAEQFFNAHLLQAGLFGVIITVQPDDPTDYVPAV